MPAADFCAGILVIVSKSWRIFCDCSRRKANSLPFLAYSFS
ncbi:hypothetical protein LDG_6335 [Legionella drancourtii LLAP12]|uniref:Uncharacterized protein n=1 Tax=Legionella drancourtii LLAP12 TaxID=658187 RepID=G9EM72_9GAMM|nr:hypothetical protein LDG_6335 [Legionella drancourtii LLAP12]